MSRRHEKTPVQKRCQNGLPRGGEELLFGGLFLTGAPAPFGPRGLPGELPGHSRDPFFIILGRFGVHFSTCFYYLGGDFRRMGPSAVAGLGAALWIYVFWFGGVFVCTYIYIYIHLYI